MAGIRQAAAYGGLLALMGMACAGQQKQPSNPTAQRVQSQQREAQQALDRANDAQKRAADQERKATQAQENVQKAQQALIEAQQSARREQAKAEQLQRDANTLTRQAAEQAGRSQQQAAQSLSQQGRQVAQGELTTAGQVVAASGDELVLQPQSGAQAPMTFTVSDQTRIRIDGQQGTLADIQQGQDARVSYQTTGSTRPEALVIDVMRAGAPPQGSAPPPSSGPAQ